MRTHLHYKTLLNSDASMPWIVFLHGAGGSIATWNRQIEAFRADYNLLLIDLRDHGNSKNVQPSYPRYNFKIISEDVVGVIEKVGIKKAHFITLSFGSVLMQSIYERNPEMVNRMIFIGGIFNANWSIKMFVHLARFFNIFLPYSAMYEVFSFLLMPRKSQQFARRVYRQQARRLSANEYLKWLGLYSEFFLLLKSFHRQPIVNRSLILMGEDDYLFLPSARKFAGTKNNISLRLVARAGHICNIDQPHLTNKAILTFLEDSQDRAKKPASRPQFETSLL